MQANCPQCAQTIAIEDARVPERPLFAVKCPKCQAVVKLPGKSAAVAGAAAAPAPAPTSPGGEAGPHRLVMKVIEPTWIRIQPDEDRAIEELLPAGASREWSAERRFLLTIGNAGGVELTLDGEALPPLGPRGAVIQRLELPRTAASGS